MTEFGNRFVEDEHGQGYFQIKLSVGDREIDEKVPALNPQDPNGGYVYSKLQQGKEVVAFRFGSHGICGIVINKSRVNVDEISRYYWSDGPHGSSLLQKQEVSGETGVLTIGTKVISGRPERVEIKGILKENGLPLSANVYFVPSY